MELDLARRLSPYGMACRYTEGMRRVMAMPNDSFFLEDIDPAQTIYRDAPGETFREKCDWTPWPENVLDK